MYRKYLFEIATKIRNEAASKRLIELAGLLDQIAEKGEEWEAEVAYELFR